MKTSLLLLLLLLLQSAVIGTAQTKLIYHRSHSGSTQQFSKDISDDDIPNSNLGVAPTHIVKSAKLDSLIYVNDSTIVMITSRYCRYEYELDSENKRWRAGKDTIKHHPIFTKHHQLSKIKKTIKNDYNFNDNEHTIFIGYDDAELLPKQQKSKQQNKIKAQQNNNLQNADETNRNNTLLILLAIGVLSTSIVIKYYG